MSDSSTPIAGNADSSPSHSGRFDPGPAGEDELPSLSWRSFGICLAIVLSIYAFLNPIWTRLYIDEVDANIWWSYAPIPVLVAVFLAFEHKLRWASWIVEMLRLTVAKFAITYVVSHGIWILMGPPAARHEPAPVPVSHAESVGVYTVKAAPAAEAVDPERTGTLAGLVVAADGRPAAGVWVGVSAGLPAQGSDGEPAPLVLANAGQGFGRDDVLVGTYQTVELRNDDELLHTAFATDSRGRRLFNYPIPPDTARDVMFERGLGVVTLGCRAHGADEPGVHLLVVDHPFWTRTDAQGRFEWQAVPAGELELVAWATVGDEVRAAVALEAGERAETRLVLPPREP